MGKKVNIQRDLESRINMSSKEKVYVLFNFENVSMNKKMNIQKDLDSRKEISSKENIFLPPPPPELPPVEQYPEFNNPEPTKEEERVCGESPQNEPVSEQSSDLGITAFKTKLSTNAESEVIEQQEANPQPKEEEVPKKKRGKA